MNAGTMVAIMAAEEERKLAIKRILLKRINKEQGMKKTDLENLIGKNVVVTNAFGSREVGQVETITDSTVVLVDKKLRKTLIALEYIASIREY